MGKISAIFSIFKSATPAEKIARAVERGHIPSIYAKDLARVENSNVREALTEQLARVANKTSHCNQMKQAQINDIIWKLDTCDDVQIKNLAEELLIGTKGRSDKMLGFELSKAEELLDIVNTAQGKYCTLFSAKTPLGDIFVNPTLKKIIKKLKQNEDAKKLEETLQYFERTFSEPRKIFRIQERRTHSISKEIMKNETQFASLREFIEMYPHDKETATYLWKKYFVSTQEPKFQKIMNEIYDNYGVRVVTNEKTKLENLIFLKEEFEIYKTASKGKAKFPVLFDIREDYLIIQENCLTGAYTNHTKIVNPARNIRATIPRHELAHLQENVLKRKRVKSNEKDRQELLNAGISETDSYYFFTNERESWAVFAEGDMSKYSEEFKHRMINKRKGLPGWITSLTQNNKPIE